MLSAATAPSARLPVVYERAREALEQCSTLDECKDWKDKAAALASYAQQAADETLYRNAMRIKGRAVRRMGELLKEIEPKHTGRPPEIGGGASPNSQTRKSAAAAAGLSLDQTKQALRIASIPQPEFEKALEAAPTLTALAKQGTKPAAPSTDHLKGRSPKDFSASIEARGEMQDMAAMCKRVTPASAVRGANRYDFPKMAEWARTIGRWLEELEHQTRTKGKGK